MTAATPGQAALQPGEIVYLYHWRFASGEQFGLYRHAEDAEAKAAEHVSEGLSEVLSMAVLDRPQEPRPSPASASQVRRHEPQAASELDGLRKALHAISLGIAEPSPKSVAEDALNGRYFDPMKDSGVWRTSDLGTAWRLLDEARAGLRELSEGVKALAGEWVADAEHDQKRVRPTLISETRARTRRQCADELRKRTAEVTDGTHA